MTDESQEAAPGAEETQVLRCPRDKAVLVETPYEAGVEVDECSVCQGRWLDRGELERIQETVERDYRKALDERPELSNLAYDVSREMSEERLHCPACGEEMARMEYARVSQVVVDVCPECRGVWLDKGELERLEMFFERIQSENPMQIPWYVRLSLLFKGRRKG
ncbi:MAG: zf-TFIIB domain-containing protein [Polyangia bacterium]|jgi:Zn-finger nucleic acid-binding protein|nr:zf-TFIIB domain-containing protein [Polyangia bacterium]